MKLMLQRPNTLAALAALTISAASIQAEELTLSLVEGNGKIVNLERPATSLFVGNPEFISVQTVNDETVFVAGLKAGSTNLLALDDENELIASYRVSVRASLNKLITQ